MPFRFLGIYFSVNLSDMMNLNFSNTIHKKKQSNPGLDVF